MHTSSYDYTFGESYKIQKYRAEAEHDAILETVASVNKKSKLSQKISLLLLQKSGTEIANK